MAFTYTFQPELKLVVVVFTGEIKPEEEARAFQTVMEDERLRPDSRFLVDRRRSTMTVSAADVETQVNALQEKQPRMGRPRTAIVVGHDYDFGMLRVLEARADSSVDHDFNVFRDHEDACLWLGVDPSLVSGPDPDTT